MGSSRAGAFQALGSDAELLSWVTLSLGWVGVNAQSQYPCWIMEENRTYLCLGEEESLENISKTDPWETFRDSQVPGGGNLSWELFLLLVLSL